MNEEIKINTIHHKNLSLNRLNQSFKKHIDLKEYKNLIFLLIGLMILLITMMMKKLSIPQN